MKKIIIALLLASSFVACSSAEVKVKKDDKIQTLREYNDDSTIIVPKRKIAIATFKNNTALAEKRAIGENLADIMATELTKTGRFVVLERDALDKVMQEVNFSNTLGEGRLSEIQELKDADFIVTGAITKYTVNTLGKKGFASTKKEQRAEILFDMRVINVKTGEIILADSGEGTSTKETGTTFGIGTTGGYDETVEADALRAASISVVENVIDQVDKTPWTANVVKINGSDLYINSGSKSNLPIGTELSVFKQGEAIMYNGELLGYEETQVGIATVARYLGEDASICTYDGKYFSGPGLVRIK